MTVYKFSSTCSHAEGLCLICFWGERLAVSPAVALRRLAQRNRAPVGEGHLDLAMLLPPILRPSPPGGTPRLYGKRDARHYRRVASLPIGLEVPSIAASRT